MVPANMARYQLYLVSMLFVFAILTQVNGTPLLRAIEQLSSDTTFKTRETTISENKIIQPNLKLTTTTTTTTSTTTSSPSANQVTSSTNNATTTQSPQNAKPARRQSQLGEGEYLIGLGLADITGPAADVNLVSLLSQLINIASQISRRQLDSRLKRPAIYRQVSYKVDNQKLNKTKVKYDTNNVIGDRQSSSINMESYSNVNNFRLLNNLLIVEHPSWNELTNMGYAKPTQDAGGIHLRQFSRAVVAVDDRGTRLVYINLDNGMVSTLLRRRVLQSLGALYGNQTYNETNVMISATHTHSGPGGFFQYMLYNIPSAGFVSQTLDLLVKGTLESVRRAHENLKPTRVYYNRGDLAGASVNRSPLSYTNNPAEERKLYEYDTDKTMHFLKFVDVATGRPKGILNWFAVHGTSMNNSNHLISSDNKGAAAIFMEKDLNDANIMPGKAKDFVAIFAQANEGDVSPNTAGPRCIDTGLPCEPFTSTCGNPPRNELCIASGPGKDMFESTKIIAYHQYRKALELLLDTENEVQVKGPIMWVHEHIDMTKQQVPKYPSAARLEQMLGPESGKFLSNATYHTCQSALGYSFAAGTTDGPGAFDFRQGRTKGDTYWDMVRDFLRRPSAEQIECHQPKPVLLSTGEMDFPYTWHPRIVPTQIFKWGQLVIVGLPGEFTTMAGRRIRAAVKSQLPNHEIILSGLSNVYSSYITTLEEYVVQRYEGASTLYGPHTLAAYVNQFTKLASYINQSRQIESNLSPPDLSDSLFSLRPGVIYDSAPGWSHYGDIVQDCKPLYECGQTVNVTFVSANPRNNPRLESTFLKVVRLDDENPHINVTVATDASWETKFIWHRTNIFVGSSRATIVWEIPLDCKPGKYIIEHFGAHKSLWSEKKSEFRGQSSTFEVIERGFKMKNYILRHSLDL